MNQPQKAASDNSAESQRQRILNHLRANGSLTTIEGRSRLDCMHPAQRVLELRRLGHPIITVWTDDFTPEGKIHRVGKYILLSGPSEKV